MRKMSWSDALKKKQVRGRVFKNLYQISHNSRFGIDIPVYHTYVPYIYARFGTFESKTVALTP
jgi:hypothetical protein